MKECMVLSNSRKISRMVERLQVLEKEAADLEKGIKGLKEETGLQISVLEEEAAMLKRDIKELRKGIEEIKSPSKENLEGRRAVGDG